MDIYTAVMNCLKSTLPVVLTGYPCPKCEFISFIYIGRQRADWCKSALSYNPQQ